MDCTKSSSDKPEMKADLLNEMKYKFNHQISSSDRSAAWVKDPLLWGLDVPNRPDLTELKKLILNSGGERFQRNDLIALQISRKMAAVMAARGTFSEGANAVHWPMEPNHCHMNAIVFAAIKNCERWTGFALSEDREVWRVHSWCVKGERIIETTTPRIKYFGIRRQVPFYVRTALDKDISQLRDDEKLALSN